MLAVTIPFANAAATSADLREFWKRFAIESIAGRWLWKIPRKSSSQAADAGFCTTITLSAKAEATTEVGMTRKERLEWTTPGLRKGQLTSPWEPKPLKLRGFNSFNLTEIACFSCSKASRHLCCPVVSLVRVNHWPYAWNLKWMEVASAGAIFESKTCKEKRFLTSKPCKSKWILGSSTFREGGTLFWDSYQKKPKYIMLHDTWKWDQHSRTTTFLSAAWESTIVIRSVSRCLQQETVVSSTTRTVWHPSPLPPISDARSWFPWSDAICAPRGGTWSQQANESVSTSRGQIRGAGKTEPRVPLA